MDLTPSSQTRRARAIRQSAIATRESAIETTSAIDGDSAISGPSPSPSATGSSHQLFVNSGTLVLRYQGKNGNFLCLCREAFKAEPALSEHIKRCSLVDGPSKVISSYQCAKCLKPFERKMQVVSHFTKCSGSAQETSSQVSPTVDRFKCRFCERVFPTDKGCGQHEKRRHGQELDAVAPQDKVPHWTSAEHDLLIQAEVSIAISLNLVPEDDALIECKNVNQLVFDKLLELAPTFSRTISSVSQRRNKKAGYKAQVAERYRETIRATTFPTLPVDPRGSEEAAIDAADSTSFSGVSSHRAPSHGDTEVQPDVGSLVCDCQNRLKTAIESHIESLDSTRNNSKLFLSKVLEDLDSYNSRSMMEVLGRNAVISTQDRTSSSDPSRIPSRRGRRAQEKAAKCAVERTIFERNGMKRCLQHLRDPTDAGLCSSETAELFKGIFEGEGFLDTEPFVPKSQASDSHQVHGPISSKEIEEQMRRINASTAPGPDGIRLADLKGLKALDLACLFNIFLYRKDAPSELKQNRTTMIPKSASPGIGDWRPITVASIVDRLFAKVIEARLSRCLKLDPRQRGFVRDLDGCGENILAYSGALKYSRARAKPLVVASLDLAKAFDSVQHSSITRALRRLSVDEVTISLIANLVIGHTTEIKHASGTAIAKLNKGVRQGWPLSPLLFLAIVDELLDNLKDINGFPIEGPTGEVGTLTGTAFADDVVVFSSSEMGMRQHILAAEQWCNSRKMRINAAKSTLLHLRRVPKAKKVVLSRSLDISIRGVRIPMVSDTFERILGVHMNYSGKVDHKIDKFGSDLELILKSRLRVMQKVAMIRTCLIPMIKFRLVYGFATLGACSQLDRIIRKKVTSILHLPRYFPIGAVHSPCNQGGLGIPLLAEVVPLLQARLIVRMRGSGNLVTRMLGSTKKLNHSIATKFPSTVDMSRLTDDDILQVRSHLQGQRMSKFLETTHGSGWKHLERAPRLFIDDPKSRGWRDSQVIDALKLRSALLPTRELMARTVARGRNIAVICRGCHRSQESLSHILGACASTQTDRVARHNTICDYISRRLQALSRTSTRPSIEVHREQLITVAPGEVDGLANRVLLKPDILVHTNTQIVVLEISVVYEHHRAGEYDSLRRVRRDKLNKYDILRKVLAARFGKPVAIRTLIVGCRGGWLASNNKLFRDLALSFTRLDKEACVEKAVRGSLRTFGRFLHHTREPLIRDLALRPNTAVVRG